ncbi:MAG: lamin tail domain-containing protein [Patescibacteria group bacterium]|jgi:hypothetical protein
MKKILYGFIILILVLIIILMAKNYLFIITHAQELPQIIFTEIMYNPQGTDTGHEWAEILNVSTSTSYVIDGQWRFSDGSNHLLTVTQGNNTLGTGQLAVLADNPSLFLQDHPDYQGVLIDTVMSLNNAGDILMLSVDSGQVLFATTTYQVDWGANGDSYTLERLDLTNAWQSSLVIGGTPGAVNSHNSPIESENIATTTPVQVEENIQATSTPAVEETNFATSSLQDFSAATTTVDINENISTTTSVDLSEENVVNEQQNNLANSADQIIINEILPNPNGSDTNDEFIELYNRGNQPVNLANWKLQDSSTKQFAITSAKYQSTIIPAFGYFVVYSKESGIALNNDGDQVRLYQSDGILLESMAYFEEAKSNWAYAKDGGSFVWTLEPTPGNSNSIKTQVIAPQSSSTVVYVNQPTNQVPGILNTDANIAIGLVIDKAKYQGLRINEFLPNPQGADALEWTELYNDSNNDLALGGFKLDDEEGGSRPYIFLASTTLAAKDYLVINKVVSKISLNNDADSVRLSWPDNQIMQEVSYEKSQEGQSYNYSELDDEWFWSASITPGALNFKPEVSQAEEVNKINNQIDIEEKNYVELNEIQSLSKGELVTIKGVVIAELGQVYKKSFYLAVFDEADKKVFSEQAVEIYLGSAPLQQIHIGDVVELSGKISITKDRARINLSKDSQVLVLDHLKDIQPSVINIQDLQDDLLGALIQINGQLIKKQSGRLIVADDNGEIRVDVKEGVKEAAVNFKEGDYVSITGILVLGTDGYRLFPRTVNDVVTFQVLGASETTPTITPQIIQATSAKTNKMQYLFFSGSGLLAIIGSILVKLKFFS